MPFTTYGLISVLYNSWRQIFLRWESVYAPRMKFNPLNDKQLISAGALFRIRTEYPSYTPITSLQIPRSLCLDFTLSISPFHVLSGHNLKPLENGL